MTANRIDARRGLRMSAAAPIRNVSVTTRKSRPAKVAPISSGRLVSLLTTCPKEAPKRSLSSQTQETCS